MAWTKAKTTIVIGTSLLLAAGTSTLVIAEYRSQSSSGDSVGTDMTIKWQVGKKYVWRMELLQTAQVTMPGRPDPMEQQMKVTEGFTLTPRKQLDTGGCQFDIQFDTIAMNINQGGNSVLNFDSIDDRTRDIGNPLAAMLRASTGARLSYETDADGKVKQISGVTELQKRISASGTPQLWAQLKDFFSEATLRRYGSLADAMPNHTMSLGDKWSATRNVGTTGGFTDLDMRYRFKNWEQHGDRQCARIELTGKLSPNSTQGIERGDVSGTSWFDPELGVLTGVDNDQHLQVKTLSGGQMLSVKLDQKVRLTLADVADAK